MPSASLATGRNFVIATTGLTQAGGATNIDISAIQSSAIQIAVETTGAVTTGTLAVSVRPRGCTSYRVLYDEFGSAISITMTAPQIVTVSACNYDSIKVTPTSYDGTSYAVYVSGL